MGRLNSIIEEFDKKYSPKFKLEEEYLGIQKLVKLSKESLSLHKKEKKFTPLVVLEVLK